MVHDTRWNRALRRKRRPPAARQLGDMLGAASADRRYEKPILVAPPAFLGTLQAALGKEARKRLTHSLAKDVSGLQPEEIHAHLAPLLFP